MRRGKMEGGVKWGPSFKSRKWKWQVRKVAGVHQQCTDQPTHPRCYGTIPHPGRRHLGSRMSEVGDVCLISSRISCPSWNDVLSTVVGTCLQCFRGHLFNRAFCKSSADSSSASTHVVAPRNSGAQSCPNPDNHPNGKPHFVYPRYWACCTARDGTRCPQVPLIVSMRISIAR